MRPAKRQVTEIPEALPTYATPCSGIARYTSACACLGATASTITVETPTTIITVSETLTPTIVEEYITIQTDEVTVTDATQTVTTTVATETVTEQVPVATDSSFHLKVLNSVRAGQYLQFTTIYNWVSVDSRMSKAQSSRFEIAANGDMSSNGRNIGHHGSDDGSWVLVPLETPGQFNDKPWRCQVTADRMLECKDDSKRTSGLHYCSYQSVNDTPVRFIVETTEDAPPHCTALQVAVEYE